MTPFQETLVLGLTETQTQAVTFPVDQSLLILAGAGTGKTRCLIHRLLWLSTEGIPLPNMAAITFTNRAAREMQTRILSKLGADPNTDPSLLPRICTFHSLAAKILREFHETAALILESHDFTNEFTILDERDSNTLLTRAAASLGTEGPIWKLERGDLKVLSRELSHAAAHEAEDKRLIEAMRKSGVEITLCIAQNSINGREQVSASEAIQRYTDMKREQNSLDYDDLIRLCSLVLLSEPAASQKYEAVLVDEYQDTSAMQEAMLQGLRGENKAPLTAVGDSDQLIYGWRHANIDNILKLDQRCPEVTTLKLEENFRSTPAILEVANRAVKANTSRLDKKLVSFDKTPWDPKEKISFEICNNSGVEAQRVLDRIQNALYQGIPHGEIAVLSRRVRDLALIDTSLAKNKIPYTVVAGRRFAEREEVRNITAWLRVLVNPHDVEATKRILTNPKRGMGAASLDKLTDLAENKKSAILDCIPEAKDSGILSKKAAEGADTVCAIFEELLNTAETGDLQILLKACMRNTGFLGKLEEEAESEIKEIAADANRRLQHLKSLLEIAQGVESLPDLLDHLSVSDLAPDQANTEKVTLSTIHGAKGLEWHMVQVIALEEGSLPVLHSDFATGAQEQIKMMEEERRLLHVACTRAKKELVLSCSLHRQGSEKSVSRFAAELEDSIEPKSYGY